MALLAVASAGGIIFPNSSQPVAVGRYEFTMGVILEFTLPAELKIGSVPSGLGVCNDG